MAFDLANKAALIKQYTEVTFPHESGKAALRFIDNNFRSQSWEGVPWKRRKRGAKNDAGRAILMLTGKLRRGNNMRKGRGYVGIYNRVKYAKAHNEGFSARVSIPAHMRRKFGTVKVFSVKSRRASNRRAEVSISQVKAHSRMMKIPRRQFAPSNKRPSPTLDRTISRMVRLQMLKILKQK